MPNHEPLHKGKPISYWVDRACSYDAEDEVRREVKAIGSAAVPYLVQTMRTADKWRDAYNWSHEFLPDALQRYVPDVRSCYEIREGVIRTIAVLGPEAEPAIPDLLRLLPQYGGPVVNALAAIGPKAKAALPALRPLLTDRDPVLRWDAAWALLTIDQETNLVLQACTNSMGREMKDEPLNALCLLASMGKAAIPAVPLALELLNDTNRSPNIRGNAAGLLGATGISSPEILAALKQGAQTEPDPRLRYSCAHALLKLDPSSIPQYTLPVTRYELQGFIDTRRRYPGCNLNVGLSFELSGLDPDESIRALKQLCESESYEMRKVANEVLASIEAKTNSIPQQ